MIPKSFNLLRILPLRPVRSSCAPLAPVSSGTVVAGSTTSASIKALSRPCSASTDLDGASGFLGRGNAGKATGGVGDRARGAGEEDFAGGSSSSGLEACGSPGSPVSVLRRFPGRSPSFWICDLGRSTSEIERTSLASESSLLSELRDPGSLAPDSSSSSRFLPAELGSLSRGFPNSALRFLRLSFFALRYRFFAFVLFYKLAVSDAMYITSIVLIHLSILGGC